MQRYFISNYFTNYYYYRPQRSCGKVIFSQASFILSTEGGCLLQCMLGYKPPRQAPPSEDPLGRTPRPREGHPPKSTHTLQRTHPRRSLQRTVRILLECFLVINIILTKDTFHSEDEQIKKKTFNNQNVIYNRQTYGNLYIKEN